MSEVQTLYALCPVSAISLCCDERIQRHGVTLLIMSGLESHHLRLREKHQKRDSAVSLCNGLPLAQVIVNLAM